MSACVYVYLCVDSNLGSAFVYTKQGPSEWVLATELVPAGATAPATFGASAAILGSTIVVGANGNGEFFDFFCFLSLFFNVFLSL